MKTIVARLEGDFRNVYPMLSAYLYAMDVLDLNSAIS